MAVTWNWSSFFVGFSVIYRIGRPGMRERAGTVKSAKARARTRVIGPAFSLQNEKDCSASRDAVGGGRTDHDQRGANLQGNIGCVRRCPHASLSDGPRESGG